MTRTCNYSDEQCKYLHGHCAAGVAPKPNVRAYKKLNWRKWPGKEDGAPDPNPDSQSTQDQAEDAESWEEREGEPGEELVLEEVTAEGWTAGGSSWTETTQLWGNGAVDEIQNPANEKALSAWGESEKNKPQHIKALEEKANMQAIGW
jgi:hypothetical protein